MAGKPRTTSNVVDLHPEHLGAKVLADAITDLAAAYRENTKAAQPAYDAVHTLATNLTGAGSWVRRKFPWLLGVIGTALTAMNVITPGMAKWLAETAARFFGAN